MEDDAGIRKVLNWFRMRSWVNEIKIYAQYNIDIPVIAKDPFLIEFPNPIKIKKVSKMKRKPKRYQIKKCIRNHNKTKTIPNYKRDIK